MKCCGSISPTNTSSANPKQHKKGRFGDWICIKCNNLNFSFRKKCNRCKSQTREKNQEEIYINNYYSYDRYQQTLYGCEKYQESSIFTNIHMRTVSNAFTPTAKANQAPNLIWNETMSTNDHSSCIDCVNAQNNLFECSSGLFYHNDQEQNVMVEAQNEAAPQDLNNEFDDYVESILNDIIL